MCSDRKIIETENLRVRTIENGFYGDITIVLDQVRTDMNEIFYNVSREYPDGDIIEVVVTHNRDHAERVYNNQK